MILYVALVIGSAEASFHASLALLVASSPKRDLLAPDGARLPAPLLVEDAIAAEEVPDDTGVFELKFS